MWPSYKGHSVFSQLVLSFRFPSENMIINPNNMLKMEITSLVTKVKIEG